MFNANPRFVGILWAGTNRGIPTNCFEMWWPGTELNRRRQPFQGCALPPELPGHASRPASLPRAARIVHFTLIVAGLPTVRNVLDYSNGGAFAQRQPWSTPGLPTEQKSLPSAVSNGPAEAGPSPFDTLRRLQGFRTIARPPTSHAAPATTPDESPAGISGRRSC